jgi:integrase/recombinase XerD
MPRDTREPVRPAPGLARIPREIARISRVLTSTGQPTYDAHIRQFNAWLKAHDRPALPDAARDYLRTLQGYAPATIANKIAALKRGFLATYKNEARDVRFRALLREAFADLRAPKVDRKVYDENLLTLEDAQKLQAAAPPWLASFVYLLTHSGLRISEACALTRADVRSVNGVAYLRILGKGKKERRVFLPGAKLDELRAPFAGRPGAALFPTVQGNSYSRKYLWQEVDALGRAVLGRRIHPHQFRHGFATREIKKRGSVKAVSLYLGHSKTSITEEMYNHDALRPEELFAELKPQARTGRVRNGKKKKTAG